MGESKFDDHVNNLCNNDCQKLNILSHPATLINVKKWRNHERIHSIVAKGGHTLLF